MNILSLEILSNNLANTEGFYAGVLGMPVLDKSESAITFRAGNTQLTFKLDAQSKAIYHAAFNIPNNQLDEALAWMSERVEIVDATPGSKIADFVNWNAKSFYFYDYNGNIMEMIARYGLSNQSDTEFCGTSITCVSEIGLAAEDVAVLCDNIQRAYNLPVFSMQPPLPNFIAMGDDDGLLILSKLNRNWHLTELPAQKCHTKLSINNNGEQQSLAFYETH